jgi:CHAP domain
LACDRAPLADKIRELVARVGAGAIGLGDAIGHALAPGMGPVQAPGAPGSGGRFSHGSSNVGRAMNQKSPGNASDAADIAETYTGKTINDDDVQTFLRTGGHPDPEKAAWCAAFVGAALRKAGVRDIPAAHGGNIASSYAQWGRHVDPQDVRRGDVVVLTRGHRPGQTGGHVGLATGPMVDGKIPTIEGNARHMVRRAYERIRPGVLIRRADPPAATKEEHQSWLRGAHAAMAAIVADPHAQRQFAMLADYKQHGGPRPSLSRHDGVRNQSVNIEVFSTDPHSAASEIARQMAGLQGRTMRDWKVA